MNKKYIFLTIIFLGIFSGMSILAIFAAKKITVASTNSTAPDFFMTNATYIKFDQQGKISNKFYTNKIMHFPAKNNFIFEKPRIKIYAPGQQPWEITANQGKSEGGKSKIDLWENVKIIQAADSNQPNFDITTTALTVYPDMRLATTKEPLTIMQSGSIAKAVGAKADFKTGTVTLSSSVEGQYQAK